MYTNVRDERLDVEFCPNMELAGMWRMLASWGEQIVDMPASPGGWDWQVEVYSVGGRVATVVRSQGGHKVYGVRLAGKLFVLSTLKRMHPRRAYLLAVLERAQV